MKINNLCRATAALTLISLTPIATAAELSTPAASADSANHTKTVVEIAAGNDSFTTLAAAVKAAGLAKTLSGDGPFTIFAPTDEAFAKLPDGTLESLLKPENKTRLQAILTLHVLDSKVLAANATPGTVKTVNGESIEILSADGHLTVGGAKILKTDIVGTNGVIHVIDTVILPSS